MEAGGVQGRDYAIAILTVLLVWFVALWLKGMPSVSFLSGDALLVTGVIVDLGILLLIVYEDFGRPLFLGQSRSFTT
jgi:hypothetical protein